MKKITLTVFSLIFAGYAALSTHYFVDSDATGLNNGTSWADAYVNLQSALTISVSGDSIWVAEGTYYPTATTTRTIYFTIPSGVKVRGGFDPDNGATTWATRDWVAYITTLSGDIGVVGTNTDNSYHVVYLSNVTAITTLDGFTITKGYADGTSGTLYYGGGIYNIASSGNTSSPSLYNCILTANYAPSITYSGSGGGMYSTTSGGTVNPYLNNCTFLSNTAYSAGGGMLSSANGGTSSPVFIECTFQSNSLTGGYGSGGGLYLGTSSGGTCTSVISGCDFITNTTYERSGGLHVYALGSGSTASPVVTECNFISNAVSSPSSYSGGGGVFNYASDGSVVNPEYNDCVFSLNSITGSVGYEVDGGGMKNLAYNFGTCNPEITDCSFIENSAGRFGGGMANYAFRSGICNPSITGCSFRKNSGSSGGGIAVCADDRYTSGSPDAVCSPVFTNCLISGNRAPDTFTSSYLSGNGGGAFVYAYSYGDATPAFINCTFSGNYAVETGGGIESCEYYWTPGYNAYISITMQNTIVYNNNCGTSPSSYKEIADDYIINTTAATSNVSYCDLQMNGSIPSGTGNVYVNPEFVTPLDPNTAPSDGGDFHLLSSSPVINAGTFIGAPSTDIEGNSRPCPAVTFPDMGAYEYCQTDMAPTLTSSYPFDYVTAVNLNSNIVLVFNEKVVAGTGSLLISTGTGTGGDFEIIPVSDSRVVFSDGQGDDNVVTINPDGTYAGLTDYNILIGSTIFDDATGNDFAGTTIHFTTEPATAVTGVIYVDRDKPDDAGDGTSWGTAKKYLQSALAIAGDPGQDDDEIWVKKGTQYPDEGTGQTNDDQLAKFTMKAGVGLFGGFDGLETARSERDYNANITTLSGDIRQTGSFLSYTVVISTSLDNTAVLDGFTITKGACSSAGGYHGGGMRNTSSSPVISNCIFTLNYTYYRGGGMYNSTSSAPVITNCTFSNNTAASEGGGGIYNYTSSPVLTNCNIINNLTYTNGGGIYNNQSPAIYTGCTVSGNITDYNDQGGGIYNYQSAATFTNCYIQGNYGGYGGGINNSSTPNATYTNCLITGNKADYSGGGMYNSSSHPSLMNCTFSGNTTGNWTSSYGGAIYNSSSNPGLTNCVIWNNRQKTTTTDAGSSIYNSGSTPVITYSLVANMQPSGAGNIDDSPTNPLNNPDFSTPLDPSTAPSTSGDFHLIGTSPCIGAGTNTGAPLTDIEENDRPLPAGSNSDMGAYENFLGVPADYIWTGTISTNWNVAGNWLPAAVPGSSDDVLIISAANNPEIPSTGTASCNNLAVDELGVLTIRSDASGAGSLITSGTLIIDGTINIERYASDAQWHLVSSPMSDATANVFLGDYLQTYTEATDTWTDIVNPATALTPGRGYALWGQAKATTYTFTGTPNTGNVSYGYTYTPGGNPLHYGFNLMGNPYPSSIDWDLLNETYGAVYYYTGSAYVSWNGGGAGSQYVPPIQGFMMAPGSAGTMNLTNAHRTHNGASGYYKESDIEEGAIILQAGNAAFMDELYIMLNENATADFDLAFDAWKLFSGESYVSQIFSFTGDKKLSIDQRPACDRIPVGFRCGESGLYSISLKENSTSGKAWLEDKEATVMHDLSQGAYSFGYSPIDPDNRFVLHLNSLGISPVIMSALNIQVYNSDDKIFIKASNQTILQIRIYNLPGNEVMRINGNRSQEMEIVMEMQPGVYFVRVTTDNGSETKKIYLN